MNKDWGTMITAMVTPFIEDFAVDTDKAARLAEKLVRDGSTAIVVGGTTGESPTLTNEERIQLFLSVKEAVGNKVPVIAGTGTNSTKTTIELTKKAEFIRMDGVMIVAPYYNKPPQEGLYRHFKTVCESTSLPVILYNIPSRTGCNVLPETFERLVDVENIVAVKEASGNLEQVVEIIRRTPFAVYSGDDSLTLPIMALGGKGVISVASHVIGREIREMIDCYLSGNTMKAALLNKELYPIYKILFKTTNPTMVKAALEISWETVGGVRSPLVNATEEEVKELREVLEQTAMLRNTIDIHLWER